MRELDYTIGLDGETTYEKSLGQQFFSDLEGDESVFLPTGFASPAEPKLHTLSEWPAQLPVALALQVEDLPQILDRFGLTLERYKTLAPLPAFRKALAEAQRDVREKGHTFSIKCRGIAEDFLDTLYLALHDPSVGLSAKVDILKWLAKMGSLEPVVAQAAATSSMPNIAIQINLS
jgi:hypothetical protein